MGGFRGLRSSILLLVAVLSVDFALCTAAELRVRAASGDPAPGFAKGFVLSRMASPRHNDSGQTVFSAEILELGAESPELVATGLFLDATDALALIVSDEMNLPDGAGTSRPIAFGINNSGQIAMIYPELGILLWQEGDLKWLVRTGAPAPETGTDFVRVGDLTGHTSFSVAAPFFNDLGEAVFIAVLSDGRRGIFVTSVTETRVVAVSESVAPGREPLAIGLDDRLLPQLTGSWIFFKGQVGEQEALFRYARSTGLQVVLAEEDAPLPGRGKVRWLGALRAAGTGSAALSVGLGSAGTETLLLIGEDGTQEVVREGQELAGLAGPSTAFRPVGLDERDRLVLVGETSHAVGFYLWEQGLLRKLVVDGDPTPLGGAFNLAQDLICQFCPRAMAFSPPNDSLEFGFMAEATGIATDPGLIAFVWRAGTIEALAADNRANDRLGERLIEGLDPLSLNSRGELLFEGRLCCGPFSSAILSTQSLAPSDQLLTLFGAGESNALRMQTEVDVLNYGEAPAVATLATHTSDGSELSAISQPVAPGSRQTFHLGGSVELLTGWGRLTVEGSRRIGTQSTLRLLDHTGLISLTGAPLVQPQTRARLIVEIDHEGNTGIAIANTGTQESSFRLTLHDSRTVVAHETLVLGPLEQRVLFVTEVFADLPVPFLGLLDVQSEIPFALTGLRQANLQLSLLPVTSSTGGAGPGPGIINLLPELPHPRGHGRLRVIQTLTAPDGQVAVLTEVGEVRLVTARESLRVVTPGMSLPGTVTTVSRTSNATRLLSFSSQGDLLLTIGFEESQSGETEGVFRWRANRLERIELRAGELEDFNLSAVRAVSPKGELLLVGHREDEIVFAVYDGSTVEFLQSAPTPPPMDSVAFGDDRRIAFITNERQTLWLLEPQGPRRIARAGTSIGGQFTFARFARIFIGPGERLLFTAMGRLQPLPFTSPSGLFVFENDRIRPVIITGDSIPGQEFGVVQSIEVSPSFDDPERARIRVNSAGEIVLGTELSSPVLEAFPGTVRGFIRFDQNLAGELIVPAPSDFPHEAPFSVASSSNFRWTDSEELLFVADSNIGTAPFNTGLYEWRDGAVRSLVRPGARFSQADRSELSLMKRLLGVVGTSSAGVVFDASSAGSGPDGLFLAESRTTHRLAVPHVVVGSFPGVDFETSLLVHNPTNRKAAISFTLFSSAGHAVHTSTPHELDAGVTVKIPVELSEAFVGWASLEASEAAVDAFVRLSVRRPAGALTSEVTVPAVSLRRERHWTGEVRSVDDLNGGVAIANPYGAATRVEIELLGPGLSIRGLRSIDIPAKGHVARLFSELFPDPDCCRLYRLRARFQVPAIALRLEGVHMTSQVTFP